MKKTFKLGFIVGRFQLFHKGHEALVNFGKALCDKFVVIVGSTNESRTVKNPFTFENGKATIKTTTAGELRMYAKSALEGTAGNWWHREFNIYDGKIVYRAGGSDQEKVNPEANKTVTLDFNAGTGSIQ